MPVRVRAALAMRRAAALLHYAAAACAAAAPDPRQGALESALRDLFDHKIRPSIRQGVALSLGWKSETMEFSLATGSYNNSDGSSRNATADDTFLFGSGSKPFTGAAVMRLVEQGKLALDDPVSKHIDPMIGSLRPWSSCPSCADTWDGILGGNRSSRVTIGHVLQMRSGIKDYDTMSGFDTMLLFDNATAVVSPLDFLDVVAALPDPFDFEPGTHVAYSSTGFVVMGLILTYHADALNGDWAAMRTSDFYPEDVARGALSRTHFFTDEAMADYLTGPGMTQHQRHCVPSPARQGADAWVRGTVWSWQPQEWGADTYFLDDGRFHAPDWERYLPPADNATWAANATAVTIVWRGGYVIDATPRAGGSELTAVWRDTPDGWDRVMPAAYRCAADGWGWRGAAVHLQNSSVLGYTCSNVVAPSLDVARWYWDLAGPAPRVVNATSLAVMTQFRTADYGWARGGFQYGTGLMRSGAPDSLGSFTGHGGFVYDFNSAQGVFDGLNASLSIVANGDNKANEWLCPVVDTAARALGILPKEQCGGAPSRTVQWALNGTCLGGAWEQINHQPLWYTVSCPTEGELVRTVFNNSACAGTALGERVYLTATCIFDPSTNGGESWGTWPGQDTARFTCAAGGAVYDAWECPCKHNAGPPQLTARSRRSHP